MEFDCYNSGLELFLTMEIFCHSTAAGQGIVCLLSCSLKCTRKQVRGSIDLHGAVDEAIQIPIAHLAYFWLWHVYSTMTIRAGTRVHWDIDKTEPLRKLQASEPGIVSLNNSH